MMETWKNKVTAIALTAAGCMGTALEGDATALIFISFISIPLFFAKENWFY